jgi:hypothetical protein
MSKLWHVFDFEETLVYSGVKAGSFSMSSQANKISEYLKCSLGKYICRDKHSMEKETTEG